MVKPKQKYVRKISNKGAAERQVTSLPFDIQSNILSRVPLESIFSCRCVCKSWYRMSGDPSFIKLYQERNNNNNEDDRPCKYIIQARNRANSERLLFLDIHGEKLREISLEHMNLSLNFRYKLSAFRIISSCNGLLCLAPNGKMDPILICNPLTRDCVILPSSRTISRELPVRSYQVGFHFDPLLENKYKVVREFRCDNDEACKFQMIAIGDSSWKDLSGAPNFFLECGFDAAIYWNGAFHWKISELDHRHNNNFILSFDLIDETFYTIFFTNYDEVQVPYNYRLVGLKGELKIVEHDCRFLKLWNVSGNKIEGFSLWLEHRFILCVPRSRLLQHYLICEIERRSYLMQVFSWEGGNNQTCRLVRFSPEIEKIYDLEINCELPNLFSIICFKPSIVSPLMST
ncbi:F-box protein At5g49610-like [Jatropha curcas]|uniref:F-box protein At5g49610-like n=1 Tax=Jatropha curcas TaxID=180498 RepID=UPI0009D7813F|nr:F-box protein At5g49610-like [Jatropha curcas]